MTEIDVAALRAAAEKAAEDDSAWLRAWETDYELPSVDQTYLQILLPTTTLDLLDRLERAEGAVERVRALRDEFAAEDHPTSTIVSREIRNALDGDV